MRQRALPAYRASDACRYGRRSTPPGFTTSMLARLLSAVRSSSDALRSTKSIPHAVLTSRRKDGLGYALDWGLMANHYHFVMQLTDGGLSEGMRELHGGYSRWIHRLTGQRAGPPLPARVRLARCSTEDDSTSSRARTSDRISRRPEPGARPDDWRWCGLPGDDRARASASVPSPAISPSATSLDPRPRQRGCLPRVRPRRTRLSRPRPCRQTTGPPRG